ncbi:MAG: rRNA maturation RNase YbeY [Gemmatimonadaceae bacterium]
MRTDDPPPARSTGRGAREPLGRQVQVSRVNVRVPLAAHRVRDIAERALAAERVKSAMLAITFVDNRAMARLNREHVGHPGATDIVTLEHARGANGIVVGDIYIAPGVARHNAHAHRSSVREEIARLVIHGVLHTLGWEHPENESRMRSPMWRRQEVLLTRARTAGAI